MYSKNKNGVSVMPVIKKIVFAFFVLFVSVAVYADVSSKGVTALGFLKYAAGARAAGLGNAFSSVEQGGADMIYWNPAAIASIDRQNISLMYLSSFLDISYGWVSYAVPTVYGSFGIAVQHFSSGKIDATNHLAQEISGFSQSDTAVSLSYAKDYGFEEIGILNYGFNLKYIHSSIEDNTANAFAFDAGAIFTLNDDITSFGIIAQNAGTKIKYIEEKESLPFVVRIGASRIFFDKLLVSIDINFPNDNDIFPSLGAEYSFDLTKEADFSLRAGYDGRQKDIDGFSSVNAGFGLRYGDYMFDYAFAPYGDLGEAHRVSLGILFGDVFDKDKTLKYREEKRAEKEKIRKEKESAEAERVKHETESNKSEESAIYGEEYGNYTDYGEEIEEKPVRPLKKHIQNVAVIDFVSSDIPDNERGVYSEMLRKQLFETGSFSSVDASKVKNIYSGNKYPSDTDLYNVLKFTKAKKIITAVIVKQGENLKFEITVHNDNLKGVNYNFTCKDSFRYVNEALKDFALKIAEDVN